MHGIGYEMEMNYDVCYGDLLWFGFPTIRYD